MKVILLLSTLFLFGFRNTPDLHWQVAIHIPHHNTTVTIPTINMAGMLHLNGSDKIPAPPLDGNISCNSRLATIDRTNRTWTLNGVPLTNAGPNTITCIYSDSRGNSTQDSVVVNYKSIAQNLPPIAIFTANPFSGNAPLYVHFDAMFSYDPDGSIASYAWDFGDLTGAGGQVADHVFAGPGTFFVMLTVTDDQGAKSSSVQPIMVLSNTQPVADFAINLDNGGYVPFQANFNGSLSYVPGYEFDPDRGITSCTWQLSFGGGTGDKSFTVPGCQFSVPISMKGNYSMTLTVTGANGGFASTTKNFQALENTPPVANFTATSTSSTAPFNVHLDASASYDQDGTIVHYEWSFSDQTTANGQIVDHVFTETGSYFITLTVTNNQGAKNSSTQSVLVQNDFDSSEQWSDGNLTRVININDGFLPLETDIVYNLTNATINSQENHLRITLNGQVIDNGTVDLTSNQIKLNNVQLLNGKNIIEVSIEDDNGLPLLVVEDLWAGDQETTVSFIDSSNNSLADVEVELKLTKDQSVKKNIIHANNNVTFTNLPNESFVITAKKGNLFGFVSTESIVSLANITLLGLKTASNISNDDFSQGTNGWDISQASPIIIPHMEKGLKRKSIKVDNDLRLSLENSNFQKITRTVIAGNQGKFYELRYKFKSIGSDAYLIAIRNATTGEIVSESYNFDRLNDPNFQIWRTLSILVSPGDLLQVEISMQRGTKRKQTQDFSFLDVDYTTFKKFKINVLEFISGQGNTRFEIPKAADKYIGIKGFSVGPRSSIYEETMLEGNIVFSGASNSAISNITITALQGAKEATGILLPSTQSLIGPQFGSGELGASEQSLFKFATSSTADFDVTTNVYLVVSALANNGDSDVFYYPVSLKPLQQYQYMGPIVGSFRFGAITRDAIVGGDDWIQSYIRPYLDSLINQFFTTNTIQYNDVSKMNGGYFKPHARHRAGEDVDLLIKDYYDSGLNSFNDKKQNGLNFIKMLEDYTYTKQIVDIGIEYSECGEFCKVIKYSCLKDGRYAKDVIQRWSGHADHFHFTYSSTSQEKVKPDVIIAFPPTKTKIQEINVTGADTVADAQGIHGVLSVDWGDGNTAETTGAVCNLTHEYASNGSKEIRVIYTKNNACYGITKTVNITNSPVVPCFEVIQRGSGSVDIDTSCTQGAIHKYKWELININMNANDLKGCGRPGMLSLSNLSNGSHTAKLTLWNVDGTSISSESTFSTSNGDKSSGFFSAGDNSRNLYKRTLACGADVPSPIASFNYTTAGPLSVTLDASDSISNSAVNEILTYEWTTRAGFDPAITCWPETTAGFQSAGTYVVGLKVTNAVGLSDRTTRLVTVAGTGDK